MENRCGDGYGEQVQSNQVETARSDLEMMGLLFQNNYLCGQKLAPWECAADPGQCRTMGNTNMYGYPAHFDLQNARLQVSYFLPAAPTIVDSSWADSGDWGSWLEQP